MIPNDETGFPVQQLQPERDSGLYAGIVDFGELEELAANQIVSAGRTGCFLHAAVFAGCAVVSAVLFPVAGDALPPISVALTLQLIAFSGIWMLLAMWTTMYGVTHLEAGRAAVLLVFELAAAVASATIIGSERLSGLEWFGAALITAAAFLEARGDSREERKTACPKS